MNRKTSRRNFLGTSTGFAAAGLASLANPIAAAAQSVGVKPGDLPDLTIKEVKVYVTDISGIHKLNSPETGELVSIVTNSGIEGNYTLGDRYATPGWLDWAKPALVGKNIMQLLPTLTSTTGMKGPAGYDAAPAGRPGGSGAAGGAGAARGTGASGAAGAARPPASPGSHSAFEGPQLQGTGLSTRGGGTWPNYYTAAADVCMWDILGKAVNRPIYKIFSAACRQGPHHGLRQFAAPGRHRGLCAGRAEGEGGGYKGYKIHPGGGQHASGPAIPSYIGHMEEIKQVRKAVGDEFVLMHDPVQRYNRFEA